MKPKKILSWDLGGLAKQMRIPKADTAVYFRDGRRISFLLERRITAEIMKGKLAPTEGSNYDLTDRQGGKWEVRSISRSGVYFCPSYMVGSNRSFHKKGFIEKLNAIKGYILVNIEKFPDAPVYILKKNIVKNWYYKGILGKDTKISQRNVLNLISGLN